MTIVFAIALVVLCALFGGTALQQVNEALASALALHTGVAALVVYLVAAALRIFRGSRATVPFVIAAVLYAAAVYLWRHLENSWAISIIGLVAAIASLLEPHLIKSRKPA